MISSFDADYRTMSSQEPGVARILCHSCDADNSPEARVGFQCRSDLLPGRQVGERITTLLVAVIVAVIWFAILNVSFTLGLFASFFLFWVVIGALVLAFGETELHERYTARAQRHLTRFPAQAIADLAHAKESCQDARRLAEIAEMTGDALVELGMTADAVSEYQVAAKLPEPADGIHPATRLNHDNWVAFVTRVNGKIDRLVSSTMETRQPGS